MDTEERNIPATPRRRREHRRRGHIPRSQEMSSVFLLFGAIFSLLFFGGHLLSYVMQNSSYFIRSSSYLSLTTQNFLSIFMTSIKDLLNALLPFFIIASITSFAGSVILGGLNFAPAAISLNVQAINPVQGVRRLFSLPAVFNLVKTILKLSVIGVVTYLALKKIIPKFLPSVGYPVEFQARMLGKEVFHLSLYLTLVFLVIAGADYYFQRYHYEKSIMMTPREAKEELRVIEGPPETRRRIRARQIQLARQRMMRAVPRATVVITNPIFIAVALRYEPPKDSAPVVVAKGGGVVAKKIREIAQKYGVPIVEKPELARLLFRLCDVGEEIPIKLYRAVAEIIAYVYRLKGLA